MHDVNGQIGSSGVNPLVERVERLDTLSELTARVRGGERRIDVTGLHGSSAAIVAVALHRQLGRPVVVCLPDQEQAEDMVSDLMTISSRSALLFPEKAVFPQRYDTEERATLRGARNHCLNQIGRGRVDIVVTSLLGFIEKTIPVQALMRSRRVLARGGEIDLEEFRRHATAIGYDHTALVEEVGQFAVRGGIIDIFDPSWEQPVRIELDDETIVSIRAFDLDTQRSSQALESITLLPAAGVLLGDESLDSLERYLRERSFPAATVESIRGELEHNRYSYLIRRYAPAVGMDGSLLDYFETPPLVVLANAGALREAFKKLTARMADILANPIDEFPFLDLFSYIHPPDYYERLGCNAIRMWRVLEGAEPAGGGGMDRRGGGTDTHGDGMDRCGGGMDRCGGGMDRRGGGMDRCGGGMDRCGGGTDMHGGGMDRCGDEDEDSAAVEIIDAAIDPARVIRFHTESHPPVTGKLDSLVELLSRLVRRKLDIYIYSESAAQSERLADLLGEYEHLAHFPVGWLTAGFVWDAVSIALLTDHEIFHRLLPRPRRKARKKRTAPIHREHLQLGDFIVHVDFGIGRYVGLERITAGGSVAECLSLRYEGGDLIYVPVEQMYLVEKYVGKEGAVPAIDKLGSNKWHKIKEKTRRALEDAARELLTLYAEREIADGFACAEDGPWQKGLEASFPYEETPHQLQATEELKRDMELPRPMDRLVCGDVGYGKTEVAIRATFKAVNAGKQVAVLVPTTILAMQHLQTFRERMRDFPVRVEMLSRFRTAGQQRETIAALKEGAVDVVIGTHRLLSADIGFRDLGLLIIDEEHRFGVKGKEKLKRFRKGVDVLTLTATPIPRTLYMALSGLRHISIIETPPRNRHPIKTEIVPFDEEIIAQAISNELGRGGQVFFVHNRVASIHSMAAFLEKLLPGTRFGVAHGQMSERDLERVILAFLNREFDVLVSTMIIESGLDFPNVNTIIINRADRFGLAQLYQLRGRVGRREQQAFAYLFVPRYLALTETARKRLQAMEDFEELGSGYRLAMRDLEIRGAGNVLGLEQHGHMVAVGFDLYCKMLRDAVEKLRGVKRDEPPPCSIDTDLQRFFPGDYIEDQNERMVLYKRMGGFSAPEELTAFEAELRDRFGSPPPEAVNLMDLTRFKLQGMAMGIARVKLWTARAEIEFLPSRAFSREQCASLIETSPGELLFKSGDPFQVVLHPHETMSVQESVRKLLQVAYDCGKKRAYL